MARPRAFDEGVALSAAIDGFWAQGYGAAGTRDLAARMGLTTASFYNAFGDKRGLFLKALDQYLVETLRQRIARLDPLPPREAVAGFVADVVERSLADPQRRGCMLINAALDVTAQDPEIRDKVAGGMEQIRAFFQRHVQAGQADGTISTAQSAEDLARLFLGVVLGIRVMARLHADRDQLEGMARPVLALLTP
ncbi:TetR/AcrR family transcriptional regulator [Nitrospirillum iridis]|uniref:TetR/AcrR family transcriptional repressor of nem operon n=1 Tax=Nitrospirillum iridis TaxID=765888 RepID=A0A7X0B6R8_9PROT|nr:TetR/AcrR family transcriptional regulator [Nitrospirillum iridis]MBB6255204.1 TetR/AcrR family transcriptional repressor of nem operon [Nitrospirillum iridis]